MRIVRRSTINPMLVWLVLATIFVHALLPTGSPLLRTSGSAFSVTTMEVSLAPSRKDKAAEQEEHQRAPGESPGDSDDDGNDLLLDRPAPAGFDIPGGAPLPDLIHAGPETGGPADYRARAPPLA